MSAKLRRRVIISLSVFMAAVCVGAALGAGGNDDGGGKYLVRAIFDNASFVIPGEDVKVAGVKVGSIDSLDVDPQHHAVVVLRIDDPAFRPFRKDATCRVGLQSLIGEQFVECDPTQVRGGDRAPAPELAAIEDGRPGAGQHLLPVAQTQSPVGQDLLNNIMRVPQQQRLPLIINEFGAGVSGNGETLNAAIKRASPVLKKADELVAILARQNKMLGTLVDDSDAVLAPLARHRKDLGQFVKNTGDAAAATAKQGDALEASFARFPGFLRELGPAADRLGALADQTTPAVANFASEAASVNETTERLGPLAQQALPTIKTLGKVADQGRTTFPRLEKIADQLNTLGTPLVTLSDNLAKLSTSFDGSGGIESLMRFIYFYTGVVNGEDASGHYTRAALGFKACVDRATKAQTAGCEATFQASEGAGDDASAAKASASSALLGYLLGDK
jgi:phospholipid/cholesterol/gamma-HCH transport system substrate-binding protein